MKNKDLKLWLKAAASRAVKTVAQTAVATIGTSMAMSEVNWKYCCSTAILAGIVSILTSIATNLPEVPEQEENGE